MPLSLDQFLFSGSGASAEIQLEAELLREEKDLLKEGLERIRGIATSFFNLEIEEDELQQRVCCGCVCPVGFMLVCFCTCSCLCVGHVAAPSRLGRG